MEPKIDGDLSDAAWQQAPSASGFIQNFPTYGLQASVRSEVRILYDDNAIYIGAYLYDDPSLIRKQLTARDGEQRQDVDYFSVFFDTYNDQQNGFQFLVTTANIQSDARIGAGATDFGDFGDKTWDAVWQSQVQIKPDGWIVEMKIPYISLRFSKKEIQTWGLQFLRFTRRNNESSYWNPVDPNLNGFANQFGKYEGLKNIQPPLRLSFSPYLTGGVRVNPDGSPIRTQWLRNGGMDVKYGLNESFTLDATLIPDFGQVISDNVINNLSPFEIRFQENRPFFTEGTELFNKSGLFYSRRIGATPGGYYDVQDFVDDNPNYELVRNPSVTQLYNGIKFSGRTKKKLGIGIFNAVTAPMKARLRDIGSKRDTLIQTEPLTNYNIIVLDQALKGRSSLTFTNTNVMRQGEQRDANVSSFDWSLFSANNNYQLRGTARYSKVFGYTPYSGGEINLVYDTVRRNGELYVRPYDGYNTTLQLAKVSGKLQFYAGNNITSHTYDPNDLGYIQSPNRVNFNGGISYNQFTPTATFIQYRYGLDITSNWLYKPYRFSEVQLSAFAFWYFRNFWDVTLSVNSYPTWQRDFFDLRTPGMFLKRPSEVTFGLQGSTDSRKRLYVNWDFSYAVRSVKDNGYNSYELGFRYRFNDKFTLSTGVFRQYEQNQRGYAFQRETNGSPIVGFRDFTETQALVTAAYNFKPRLNLTLRTRHYWNKVIYNSFYNTDLEGELTARPFISNRDENYNAFNLDAFLTWDFRLGSRVIVGWKNWLGDSFGVDGSKYSSYLRNLGQTLAISHGNELTVKLIYFLDYNQLKKGKIRD
ncbi:MAG TPA: DUF5916 domain-containing protein [Flavisolibacter sp.]|nr:DUF5916 domain-containing protein [Flavisolibacter sp.]